MKKRYLALMVMVCFFCAPSTLAVTHQDEATTHEIMEGMTLLGLAAMKGDWCMAEDLIKKGASVNLSYQKGFRPIDYAIKNGHYETVELLIRFNAAVNEANSNGQTPLQLAERGKKHRIRQLLLENGALQDGANRRLRQSSLGRITTAWVD
jgi:ankyrin repeat protein